MIEFFVQPTKEERSKRLLAVHEAKLTQIRENPTQATLLSERDLTLEEIKQSLKLTSIKEISLPSVGDGFGGNLIQKAIQTDNQNVYMINSVREKSPTIGNTEILYFGNDSRGLKRYQKKFSE